MKRLEVVGNRLVAEQNGSQISMDVGADPVSALPHVARGMLNDFEREAYDLMAGFAQKLTGSPACAAIIVRDK